MEISEIMTVELTTVSPTQSVGKIYETFEDVHYHHLPVTNESKLVGIISDRDVIRGISGYGGTARDDERNSQFMNRTAADIMTKEMITVDRSTSIDCASILLLENNISCLPVVDLDNKLEGILTWKDILRYHVYADE